MGGLFWGKRFKISKSSKFWTVRKSKKWEGIDLTLVTPGQKVAGANGKKRVSTDDSDIKPGWAKLLLDRENLREKLGKGCILRPL